MAAGALPRRAAGPRWPVHGLAVALLAAVLFAWAGLVALVVRAADLPPKAAGTMVAVFPPGFDEADALAAVVRADGLPVRTTWLGNVWVVHGPAPGFAGRVREEGAWLALAAVPFEPGLLGGCPFVPHVGPGEGSGLPIPYAPR